MHLYERPYYWWGDVWSKPAPRSLGDLQHEGILGEAEASWLVGHIGSGGSLIVAAEKSRVGKSTLAWALTDAIASSRIRIFIRGNHEPFDWVRSIGPDRATLLVNEFSSDLPVYCWGSCAKRVLTLAKDGYQVLGCMHGQSVDDIATTLRGPAIGATAGEIASLNVVAFRNTDAAPGQRLTRLTSVARMVADDEGTIRAEPAIVSNGDLPVWSGSRSQPRR